MSKRKGEQRDMKRDESFITHLEKGISATKLEIDYHLMYLSDGLKAKDTVLINFEKQVLSELRSSLNSKQELLDSEMALIGH